MAGRYRGFILDLWGVIHDGVTPYPGAIDCLHRLKAGGARVVLLSNAPRRAHTAAAGLRALGIGTDLYDGLVTSGEATWVALAAHPGARIYHLGPERDRSVIEGRDLVLVRNPEEGGPAAEYRTRFRPERRESAGFRVGAGADAWPPACR